ncbi:MAG: GAF domain-containing protein, partial [Candidatus Edwardsbacteria bacterium]|nr:GAF domain-containing protein [Candidatus Edwardsbacteria bacterium]
MPISNGAADRGRRQRDRNDSGRLLFAAKSREQLYKGAVNQTAARYKCSAAALINRDPGALPISRYFGIEERFLKARIALLQRAKHRQPKATAVSLIARSGGGNFARLLLRPFGYRSCLALRIGIAANDRGQGGAFRLELYFEQAVRLDKQLRHDLGEWITRLETAFARCYEHEALQRENRELLTLAQVSRTVASSLDPEQVFESIYTQSLRLVKPRNMLLALAEPERRMFNVIFEYEHGKRSKPSAFPMGPGLATIIWKTKQAIVTGDYLSECRKRNVRPAGTPARSWLGLPLLCHGRCLGVLLMWDYTRDDSFIPADVRVIQHLANQAATAIA